MYDRFLVVGLGSIGRRHVANLRRMYPKALIAAVRSGKSPPVDAQAADVDTEFTDWSQAIAFSPAAAIICSPASHHLEAARVLLSAGIPMLIEKPVADKPAGLQDFATDARKAGVPIAVGYNLRFSPALLRTRQLISDGAIGEVLAARAEVGQYLPDWRPQSRYQDGVSAQKALGGGPLLELSHEIDYLYWMFGLPAEVTATGGRISDLEIDVEDAIELTLRYEAPERLLNIHLDFLQRSPDRRCRFIGSEGTLLWDAMRDTIDVYRASTKDWENLHVAAADRNQMYLDELAKFFELIAGGTDTLARLDEACDVLAIVEAARNSLMHKQTVKVDGFARRLG